MSTDSTFVAPANSAEQSTPRAPTDRRARNVVTAALLGAIPAELLLRTIPGINVALAAIVAAGALLWASRDDRPALRGRVLLMAVFVGLASIAALRAESMLWFAMFVAMIATMVLAVLPSTAWLRSTDPAGLLARCVVVVARCAGGPLWMLTRAIDWRAVMPGDRALLRHARGIAISLAVLIPFLGLFSSADPAFAAIVREVVDLQRLFTHAALWSVLAWLALGWLGVALFPDERTGLVAPRLPGADANWVLGLLLALFVAFVAVQFRYFYGGEELVLSVTGLTYAEYARRGFFELVVVAALLLAVLLATDGLTRDASAKQRRVLHRLALALIALLGVILISALQRMNMYIGVYGLTQLRFFTTAFMLWLVVVFGWFSLTVLRDHRERFLGGVYVTGIAAVFALAAIDPIGRIADFNVEHGRRTGRLDVLHLAQLGPDAAPWVVATHGQAGPEQRCMVARQMLSWTGDESGDWDLRSWNRSRERARSLVLPLRESLVAECPSTVQSRGETR